MGQNRGLKLNHKAYVYRIDVQNNIVYVSKNKESSLLSAQKIKLKQWHRIREVYELPLSCSAKIRYRQIPQAGKIISEDGDICFLFDEEQWAIAPGQSVVAYLGEECLGAGMIV
ncbi:MAG: hypothetical protein GXP45_06430 [bacterium]|nr:hypothetical protein [bacterium]